MSDSNQINFTVVPSYTCISASFITVLKLKVKLSLCLNKHHAMKTYWGSGGIALGILEVQG
jgi:hypothetical protein